jgi:hypothetical protein
VCSFYTGKTGCLTFCLLSLALDAAYKAFGAHRGKLLKIDITKRDKRSELPTASHDEKIEYLRFAEFLYLSKGIP